MGQHGATDCFDVDAERSGDYRDAVWIRGDFAPKALGGTRYRKPPGPVGSTGGQDGKGSRRAEKAQHRWRLCKGRSENWKSADEQSPMFSPAPTSASPAQSALTATAPPDTSPPPAETVQRANTLGPRGRRLSDSNGKKRGVSPVSVPLCHQDYTDSQMGERLLRDHGHF
jgi:hypothetical protein